ncbi:RNA polymerase sigma factor [Actinomycetospora soli]|uniref:RNA polymerase sigma factor n=1 Tax=Actinomycetospora soli TaxID=2893887 RepID=UPI001E39EC3B|nr:sigma-70 family RNA polymerase sigma factor [Actinomycetospora soli]MCD2185966.1 sigma-70 family RNA polymerase sigma factor [Actinomycetospora soli]
MTPGRDAQDDDFDAFVRRCQPRLVRRAWSVAVQSGTDHHALLSHALEVMWLRWSGIDADDGVRLRFAGVVMVNRSRDLRRSAIRRREVPDEGDDDREVPPGQWGADPVAEVLQRESRLAFHRAVARLPEEEKRIMMYRTQEIGLARIALETGCSVGEVRAGLARAKRALRRDLGLPARGGTDGL